MPTMRRRRHLLAAAVWLPLAALAGAAWGPGSAHAAQATVAVATNFAPTLDALAPLFHRATGHTVRPAAGSTGKLYAQIVKGAPFDAFLAADEDRPARLVSEGHAVAGSRFTYAVGRLALWSPAPGRFDGAPAVPDAPAYLRSGDFRHLALANPDLAPYGAAARQVLRGLDLWETVRPRIVRGENVGHALQMVATGGAELGFVALSQLRGPRAPVRGSLWLPPDASYAPIRQDAVLLARGADNPAARAFLAFLKGPDALGVLERFGYRIAP